MLLFLGLMALAQPPVVTSSLVDRIEPRILGLPFLYVYLLGVYSALIGVLLWAAKRLDGSGGEAPPGSGPRPGGRS